MIACHLGPAVRGNDGEVAAVLSTDRVQGVRRLLRTGGRSEHVGDNVGRQVVDDGHGVITLVVEKSMPTINQGRGGLFRILTSGSLGLALV